VVMVAGFGTTPGMAQSRAHVYLLRGLMNIFSLGMDTLAEKIQHRGGERCRSGYLLPGSRNGAGVPSGAGIRKASRIIDTMT
jgi:hypothetical protein